MSSRKARPDDQAVLYCKTIMSQGLWFGEGYNNVHGRVLNPYNVSQQSSMCRMRGDNLALIHSAI